MYRHITPNFTEIRKEMREVRTEIHLSYYDQYGFSVGGVSRKSQSPNKVLSTSHGKSHGKCSKHRKKNSFTSACKTWLSNDRRSPNSQRSTALRGVTVPSFHTHIGQEIRKLHEETSSRSLS